jgi:hypothetical protein
MPSVYREVEVDVALEDFENDDLIDELESRGFKVFEKDESPDKTDDTIQEMIWRYKNGYIEDAMILLERRFPELFGISKRIN